MQRYDKQQVLENVTIDEYYLKLGVELRQVGETLRGPCVLCGGSDNATKFHVTDDVWYCHSCNQGGDLLSLYTGLTGVDFDTAVNELGAMFNLTPAEHVPVVSDKMLTRAVEKYENEVECNAKYAAAVNEAEALWGRLLTHNSEGERYLQKRAVSGCRDLVRFSHQSICLPLKFIDGEICNVVGRRFSNEVELKVRGLIGCPTLGVFAQDSSLHWDSSLPLVLVEGVFDYLSAEILFSGLDVCGVHGVANLSKVVALLRRHIFYRKVIIVKQHDTPADEAARLCKGLLGNVKVVECAGYKDLNDMLMFSLAEDTQRWVEGVLK